MILLKTNQNDLKLIKRLTHILHCTSFVVFSKLYTFEIRKNHAAISWCCASLKMWKNSFTFCSLCYHNYRWWGAGAAINYDSNKVVLRIKTRRNANIKINSSTLDGGTLVYCDVLTTAYKTPSHIWHCFKEEKEIDYEASYERKERTIFA